MAKSTTWGLPPHTDECPVQLRPLKQWVNWRAKLKPNGKYDKIPVQPTLKAAMVNAPQTWCGYKDAIEGYASNDDISGIGLCLKDARVEQLQLVVIDIDDSVNHPLLRVFADTTVDTSPSGNGHHMYMLVELEDPTQPLKSWKTPGLELFADSGYVTVTWRWIEGHDILRTYSEADVVTALATYRPQTTTPTSTPIEWDVEEASQALERIDPDCDYQSWLNVGLALHSGSGGSLGALQMWETWSLGSPKSEHNIGGTNPSTMWSKFDPHGKTSLASLYYLAGPKPPTDEGFEVLTDTSRPFFDSAVKASTLLGPPPTRIWCWDDWMPIGTITALAGPPASAKSTMALQLCIHKALGLPFLNRPISQGHAVFITVEDDMDELWNRVHRICAGLGVDVASLTDLDLHSLSEEDTLLVAATEHGVKAKKLMTSLSEYLTDRSTQLLILDLVSDFWDGSENSRQEISPYIRRHLGGLATQHQMGVLALSHPSVAAMKDGRTLAGSTATLGSYRSVIGMARQKDNPELIDVARTKANYADMASAVVRWDHGYLREVSIQELDAAARERQLELWTTRIFPKVEATLRPDGLTTQQLVWVATGKEAESRNGVGCLTRDRVGLELDAMVEAGWLVDGSETYGNGKAGTTRKTYAIGLAILS